MAFIVMPAAHGKSYHQGRTPGVEEADYLCDCKATPQLRNLRTRAKQDGKWQKYDALWGSYLAERASPSCVTLVPAYEIGIAMGRTLCLGALVLSSTAWEKNLSQRGEPPSKYQWGYDHVLYDNRVEVTLVDSNDELALLLTRKVKTWQSQIGLVK